MNSSQQVNLGEDPISLLIFLIITLWSISWKGLALWRSARAEQRNWFLIMLIVNFLGIIEIVYLFKFAKKPLTFKEMKSWIGK